MEDHKTTIVAGIRRNGSRRSSRILVLLSTQETLGSTGQKESWDTLFHDGDDHEMEEKGDKEERDEGEGHEDEDDDDDDDDRQLHHRVEWMNLLEDALQTTEVAEPYTEAQKWMADINRSWLREGKISREDIHQ